VGANGAGGGASGRGEGKTNSAKAKIIRRSDVDIAISNPDQKRLRPTLSPRTAFDVAVICARTIIMTLIFVSRGTGGEGSYFWRHGSPGKFAPSKVMQTLRRRHFGGLFHLPPRKYEMWLP
jgi:hypothetical protein